MTLITRTPPTSKPGRVEQPTAADAGPGPVRLPVASPAAAAEEVAIAGAQYAYESGVSATMAAVVVLERMTPDPDASASFIRAGVASAIQRILDADRDDATSPDPEGELLARRSAVRGNRVLKGDPLADIWLVGANHQYRPISTFNAVDWEFVRNDAGARAAGWGRRRDVADLALTLLSAESKETAEQLSKKATARLREAAAEAWR